VMAAEEAKSKSVVSRSQVSLAGSSNVWDYICSYCSRNAKRDA
jgi:hypothetical protein